jgi:hypothetical protein
MPTRPVGKTCVLTASPASRQVFFADATYGTIQCWPSVSPYESGVAAHACGMPFRPTPTVVAAAPIRNARREFFSFIDSGRIGLIESAACRWPHTYKSALHRDSENCIVIARRPIVQLKIVDDYAMKSINAAESGYLPKTSLHTAIQ